MKVLFFLLFSIYPQAQDARPVPGLPYYFIMGCDTVLTYRPNPDSMFAACGCISFSAVYLYNKAGKLNLSKLRRDFNIEMPARTGAKVQKFETYNDTLSITFINDYKARGIETVRVIWRYDCADNRLRLVGSSVNRYK